MRIKSIKLVSLLISSFIATTFTASATAQTSTRTCADIGGFHTTELPSGDPVCLTDNGNYQSIIHGRFGPVAILSLAEAENGLVIGVHDMSLEVDAGFYVTNEGEITVFGEEEEERLLVAYQAEIMSFVERYGRIQKSRQAIEDRQGFQSPN